MRMVNCARGRFPIAAGSDDLLAQCADELAVRRKSDPTPITIELEVTNDAH